jgi:hypothetical protein
MLNQQKIIGSLASKKNLWIRNHKLVEPSWLLALTLPMKVLSCFEGFQIYTSGAYKRVQFFDAVHHVVHMFCSREPIQKEQTKE